MYTQYGVDEIGNCMTALISHLILMALRTEYAAGLDVFLALYLAIIVLCVRIGCHFLRDHVTRQG